ncbi:MAG: pitrilysin family protein [Smithella sp.]|nr:pitrilysin family protein [Smithella sp.]
MKRNNLCKTLLILVFFFLASHPSYGFDLKSRVQKTKLPNGITVLMLERHLSPTVSLYVSYRVGAVDEEKGASGAAHFLEHMMFKGTTSIGTKDYKAEKKILADIEKTGRLLDREKNKAGKTNTRLIKKLTVRLKTLQSEHKKYFIPNEIDRLYTENGGLDMNAGTGQDTTTYHVSLPANKIELWARIESDRLLHPVFREFYTERDVVMEERRQRIESDPDGKLYEQFMKTAYPTHPYGKPVIGWAEDLTRLSPDDLKKILKRYTTPKSIVIAVVGDIKPDATLKIIEKYFGRIPSNQEMKIVVPEEPPQKEERRTEVIFDANPMMIIGYHKPNAPHDDDYVFDVLEAILSKGRTSRLYNSLVTQQQIAKSVSAINGIPASRYPNLFTIFAQPRHPHTNKELEEKILQEIEKLKTDTVPEEELVKAKNNIKMSYIQSLDSNGEIASTLSYYEVLLGDFQYFANYPDNIDKVTAEDIRQAAVTYFKNSNRTTAVLNKKM